MIFYAAKLHFSNELAKFLYQILLFLRIIIYYPSTDPCRGGCSADYYAAWGWGIFLSATII